mmetsp:Transcript_2862/g.10101  ORF Transcript_2862/g.10101 Transcript_2862/m.10101 type:complete len:413 (-) Transcript_2862:1489-2727(-)
MLQRVLEENEVHVLANLVVLLQDCLKHRLDIVVVAKILIQPDLTLLECVAVVTKHDRVRHDSLVECAVLLLHRLRHLAQEEVLVLLADQAVVEDAHALVAPQAHERRGTGVLVWRREQQALADAAQVAQVEDVVEAARRWWQFLEHVLVHLKRHLHDVLRGALHLVPEVAHMALKDRLVDRDQGLLARELDLEHVEERDETRVHVLPRTARRAHGAQEVHILDVLPVEVLAAVVEALAIDEHLEQRNGLLRAVQVCLGHVQVVDEYQELLAHRRSKGVLGALLHRVLHPALHVDGGGAAGEVHVEHGEAGRFQVAEVLGHRHSLGRAALANKQDGVARLHDSVQQPRGAHRVHRGHEDAGKAPVGGSLVSRHHAAPRAPPELLRVEAVLIQRLDWQLRRCHRVRVHRAQARH